MPTARPLAVIAVLLFGLAALKALSTGEAAFTWLESAALAAPPTEQSEDEAYDDADGADDAAPAEAGPVARAIADRQSAGGENEASQGAPAVPQFRRETASEREVLASLRERARALEARETELDTREALLEVAEQEFQDRLSALETVRGEVEALLGQLDGRVEAQVDHLVALYVGMEPDAAAAVISRLDEETKVLVADRMQTDQTRKFAAILQEMDPEEVAELSLALRLRAVPQQSTRDLEERLAAAGG